MKRALSLVLAILTLASCAAIFSGCSKKDSKDFPVQFGDVTVREEPKNVVVLSDSLADIISYIGYDVKMVGRSIECDQDFLKIVPSVGTADNPAIDTIESFETDTVIADERLTEKAKGKLEDAGITVVTMTKAGSFDELRSLYENLGMVLGGKVTGAKKGADAYDELLKTLSDFKHTVSGSVVRTAAYLYIEPNGQLCTFTGDSIEAKLFSYNCAVNIFSGKTDPVVLSQELRIATPTYIFYDDEGVLSYLENDPELSGLAALSEGRILEVPLESFSRQGVTYERTVYEMMNVMFVRSETAAPTEPETEEVTEAAAASTEAETAAPEDAPTEDTPDEETEDGSADEETEDDFDPDEADIVYADNGVY